MCWFQHRTESVFEIGNILNVQSTKCLPANSNEVYNRNLPVTYVVIGHDVLFMSLVRLIYTDQHSASTLHRVANLFTTMVKMFHTSSWQLLTVEPQ